MKCERSLYEEYKDPHLVFQIRFSKYKQSL